MRIAILAYTLSAGGFTTSMLNFIHLLQSKGIEVQLFLFEKADFAYYGAEDIPVQYVNCPRKPKSKLQKFFGLLFTPGFLRLFILAHLTKSEENRQRYSITFQQALPSLLIREYTRPLDLRGYDCAVSWQEVFPDYFLAEKTLAKKKIGFIHPDYVDAGFNAKIDLPYFEKLDKILFISKATRDGFLRSFPQLASKTAVQYNVLPVEKIRTKAVLETPTFEKGQFDILSVCRLDEASKALSRAVHIAARLKADGFSFKWYVAGSGADKAALETQIKAASLQDVFILLGEQQNPYPFMKKADLFVLQSYYEGKPMAVEEALLVGTPVLVSAYASAREQVQEGVTGFIAENNEEAIYQKMKYVLQHKEKLTEMHTALKQQDVSQYFDVTPFLALIK